MRRLGKALLVLAVLAAAGLLLTRWYLERQRPPELEAQWVADVFVLAGDGIPGTRDGDSGSARFDDPFGVASGADGSIYVSTGGEGPRIRRITPDGVVASIAGSERGFVDGIGQAARFNAPSALALDPAGTLYVADTGNNAIRRVTQDGLVSTVAGDGIGGYRDGPARQAQFNGPIGIAIDSAGRVIVADSYNDRIRAITQDGNVITIAGGPEPGFVDGALTDARFDTPSGIAVDTFGNIHVADTGNDAIRLITPQGTVRTRNPMFERLRHPIGIAAALSGEVYVTDEDGRILEFSGDDRMRVVAGSSPGFRDGTGTDAKFRLPTGVAFVVPGRLIVADAGNALVRLVVARARAELRAPSSPRINPRFDPGIFDWLPLLWPVSPLEGPHEIAGTAGEARGDSADRFHAGIDVRVDNGTPVLAVRNGSVTGPLSNSDFGSLNEWMRVGPLMYVHMRVGRGQRDQIIDPTKFVPTYDEAGKVVRIRMKRGARFATGDVIGTVNRFNHVHLNVGWPGDEYNPLRFGPVQFADTVPPAIARGGIRLFDENGQILARRENGRLIVSGRVQIVVNAWDQVDGNRPGRRLGLYSLGYQVLTPDGAAAPGFETLRETIRFDRLTSDPDAPRLVFAPGSGIPFYGRRSTRFLYIVTNTFRGGIASPGMWDSSGLPPGDYILRVKAADIRGNEAMSNRDVAITIRQVGDRSQDSSPTGPQGVPPDR